MTLPLGCGEPLAKAPDTSPENRRRNPRVEARVTGVIAKESFVASARLLSGSGRLLDGLLEFFRNALKKRGKFSGGQP